MPASHFDSRMGLALLTASLYKDITGGVSEGEVFLFHQSSSDISNNSNLESITKTNKDDAGESAAGPSDWETAKANLKW